MIPATDEIRALHKEIAPSEEAFDLVYTHCQIVWEVASQIIDTRRPSVDAELVRAGCLLHDIGVHLLDGDAYIRHGVLGEAFLRERGYPEAISRICAHHTGVGIGREDVVEQGLPLPVADYLADSGEERLVEYADKFHSKTTPPVFVTAATYEGQARRFGAGPAARFGALVAEYGEPELTSLARRYGHPVT